MNTIEKFEKYVDESIFTYPAISRMTGIFGEQKITAITKGKPSKVQVNLIDSYLKTKAVRLDQIAKQLKLLRVGVGSVVSDEVFFKRIELHKERIKILNS